MFKPFCPQRFNLLEYFLRDADAPRRVVVERLSPSTLAGMMLAVPSFPTSRTSHIAMLATKAPHVRYADRRLFQRVDGGTPIHHFTGKSNHAAFELGGGGASYPGTFAVK